MKGLLGQQSVYMPGEIRDRYKEMLNSYLQQMCNVWLMAQKERLDLRSRLGV